MNAGFYRPPGIAGEKLKTGKCLSRIGKTHNIFLVFPTPKPTHFLCRIPHFCAGEAFCAKPPRPITFEEFTAFIEQDISTQRTRAFQEIEATLAAMEP
jgi:hypothetical protein